MTENGSGAPGPAKSLGTMLQELVAAKSNESQKHMVLNLVTGKVEAAKTQRPQARAKAKAVSTVTQDGGKEKEAPSQGQLFRPSQEDWQKVLANPEWRSWGRNSWGRKPALQPWMVDTERDQCILPPVEPPTVAPILKAAPGKRQRASDGRPAHLKRRRREELEGNEGSASSSDAAAARQSKAKRIMQVKQPVANCTLKLYKMGEFCCNVVASYVRGSDTPLKFDDELQINSRTKAEHVKTHLDKAGDLATVWYFSAAHRRDCAAYDALCEYFVQKQRVGLVQTASQYVYIIPPDDKYLSLFNLPVSNYVVAFQVPARSGV
mmetsp:Transcript_20192/g.36594  ORF Transcript_20192/g.36594 Transcript_20192/m.36594 type:complete len:321 (-) Transcript_20192:41-1003(-)